MVIRLSENQDAGYQDSRVSGKRTEGRWVDSELWLVARGS